MHALLKHTLPLALALCAACSGADAGEDASYRPAGSAEAALSAGGAPVDAEAPLPLTEEELQRLLDALEQEIGSRK